MSSRAGLAGMAAVIASALAPAAAGGATAQVTADGTTHTLVITAAGGETNQMALAAVALGNPNTYSVTDAAAPLTAGAGCTGGGPAGSTVTCSVPASTPGCAVTPCPQALAGYTLIGVDLRDGDDTLDSTAIPPRDGGSGAFILTERTGAGDDSIIDGEAAALLYPDDGADRVTAGGGSDWIYASGSAPDGADVYDLGDGTEQTMDYRFAEYGVSISLDGRANDGAPGEKDEVLGTVEYVIGGAGDDKIINPTGREMVADGLGGDDELTGGTDGDQLLGGSGDDRLRGGAGDDALAGGSGADRMSGGGGADKLASRSGLVSDGDPDRMDCGSGEDRRSFAGPGDRARRCETVKRIG